MLKKILNDRSVFLLTGIACVLVYAPVVFLDFQRGWDDGWMVMNRFTYMGFTIDNLKTVFTGFYAGQYGPINEVIYMAIYAIFGYNPAVYHLYPLLLHIANSCLVLLFIKRLTGRYADPTTVRLVSFLTALLFAIHPLQVESIAWISASKIPLCTLFMLLAMITYIRYADTGKIRYYIGTFLLFLCSFGSKEESVVFPALLILLDMTLGRTKSYPIEKSGDSASSKCSWGYLIVEKLPFLLFALFAGLATYANQSADLIEKWAGYPFGQRMVFACYSIVEYIGKHIFPVKLLHLYPFPMAPGKDLPAYLYIYVGIMLIAFAYLIKNIKRNHWQIIFGLLFFFINMVLVLHFVAMSRFSIMADRYVYLGSVGLFFIVAWYGVLWIRKMKGHTRKLAIVVVVCYLLYLGSYAHYRTHIWKDSKTLKKEFIELIDEDLLKKTRYRQ